MYVCMYVYMYVCIREREKEGERKGEKHQCVVALNPLSHTSQGSYIYIFLMWSLCFFYFIKFFTALWAFAPCF